MTKRATSGLKKSRVPLEIEQARTLVAFWWWTSLTLFGDSTSLASRGRRVLFGWRGFGYNLGSSLGLFSPFAAPNCEVVRRPEVCYQVVLDARPKGGPRVGRNSHIRGILFQNATSPPLEFRTRNQQLSLCVLALTIPDIVQLLSRHLLAGHKKRITISRRPH